MSHHCRPPAPCPRHKSRHPRTCKTPIMRRGGVLPRPITGALLVPLRRGRRPRRPALPRSLFSSVGATLAVARGRGRAPPLCTTRNAPSRADRVVRPYKIMPCRAGPMCPAVPPYPLQKARHCHSQCAHWLWQSVLLKSSPTTRCPTRRIPSGSRGFRRGFLCPISIFP